MSFATLEEAIADGRGGERPFRCPEHDDSHASASVNVNKGVWYCYVCHARGRLDGKRVPTDNELETLLRPETAVRVYPASWLTLFGYSGYWATRFPDWLCWALSMGTDPITGDGTFPVYTPKGQLAGVGRRLHDGEVKYRYPFKWSSSHVLGGTELSRRHSGVIVLVEGRADAAALWEMGIPAYACFGAGLHHPQLEQVARLRPDLVLLGFDADDAGQRAIHGFTATNGKTQPGAMELLRRTYEVAAVDWSEIDVKDAAGAAPKDRIDLIGRTVAATHYGAAKTRFRDDAHLRMLSMQAAFWSHQQETQDG